MASPSSSTVSVCDVEVAPAVTFGEVYTLAPAALYTSNLYVSGSEPEYFAAALVTTRTMSVPDVLAPPTGETAVGTLTFSVDPSAAALRSAVTAVVGAAGFGDDLLQAIVIATENMTRAQTLRITSKLSP